MSNSSLVTHTRISPNSSARTGKIDTITIHHMAGTGTVEACGVIFAQASRGASSNYGVDNHGHVGLYVEESRRAWTSSNRENDNRAVTIEVANDEIGGNWHVSDKSLEKTIELCVDICQRNGIDKLNFTGDKTGNLTMHKWFAATACPGPYLESKFPYIADEVNKRLGVSSEEAPAVTLALGDKVTLAPGAKYTTGKTPAAFIFKTKLYVRAINGDNITVSIFKSGAITGVVSRKYIVKDGQPVVESATPPATVPYLVRVKCSDLNIRKGPGVSYGTSGYILPGVYTIVDEKNGFGKLKSGAGWISLDYTTKI